MKRYEVTYTDNNDANSRTVHVLADTLEDINNILSCAEHGNCKIVTKTFSEEFDG